MVIRGLAVAVAALLLVGGARVATYSETSSSELTGKDVWERLLTVRSARVRMATDRSVAGRAPIRITVAGTIETAAQRTSLVVERDGRRQYDEVTVGVQVYVRPKTQWFTFVRAADDAERPIAMLGLLADAGPLAFRGGDEVDGAKTTRYATKARGLTMEIWLDRDGLPRRVTVYEGPNTRTVAFSDFLGGQPVAVPVGATSVHDLAEAIRRAAG